MRSKSIWLVVVLAASTAMTAAASATPAHAETPAGKSAASRDQARQQIRARVQALRKKLVADKLGLDQATSDKLAAVFDQFEEAAGKLRAEAQAVRGKLYAAVSATRPDDKEVNTQLDKLLELRKRRDELQAQRIAGIRKLLTPVQAARLIVHLPHIDAKIRAQLTGKRGRAGGDVSGEEQE